MSEIVRLKTQTQIDDEAAVWTWRLDSGELTAAERGELEAWLRVDYRHRRTFEELGRTWSALDRLAKLAGDAKIAAFAADCGARNTGDRPRPRCSWSCSGRRSG
jgi:ferric-dicitrate binding protein FerR (iron transport regulator)